jgi:hypothetical protein
MGSFDLQPWTRIGTKNQPRQIFVPRGTRIRTGTFRFMESLDRQLWTRIGAVNRLVQILVAYATKFCTGCPGSWESGCRARIDLSHRAGIVTSDA